MLPLYWRKCSIIPYVVNISFSYNITALRLVPKPITCSLRPKRSLRVRSPFCLRPPCLPVVVWRNLPPLCPSCGVSLTPLCCCAPRRSRTYLHIYDIANTTGNIEKEEGKGTHVDCGYCLVLSIINNTVVKGMSDPCLAHLWPVSDPCLTRL